MQIAHRLAGYSLGEADLLRRAMGKKIAEEMAAQRERFVSGATQRGYPPKKIEKIFDLMAQFAGYGFNKSHSAAYALLAQRARPRGRGAHAHRAPRAAGAGGRARRGLARAGSTAGTRANRGRDSAVVVLCRRRGGRAVKISVTRGAITGTALSGAETVVPRSDRGRGRGTTRPSPRSPRGGRMRARTAREEARA